MGDSYDNSDTKPEDISRAKESNPNEDRTKKTEHYRFAPGDDTGSDIDEIFGRITDAFLALDTDARVTYLNEQAEQLLGLPAEQLLGTVIWEPFPKTFEETFRDGYQEAIKHQEPMDREIYYPVTDCWYYIRAYPSNTGLSIYYQDITERKQREQQLDYQREQLSAINQLNRVLQDTIHSIIDTSSRAEIEQTVCDRLEGVDPYMFIWISHVDRGESEVTPHCMAGGAERYLNEITVSITSDDPTGQEPTGTAIRTHKPQFIQDTLSNVATAQAWIGKESG